MVLVGIGITLAVYPSASDLHFTRKTDDSIANYQKAVESVKQENPQKIEEIKKEAEAYNQSLIGKSDRFLPSKEESRQYQSLLRLNGTEEMGWISIPAIDLNLPIGHSLSDEVLLCGAGHMEGSFLPVGGKGTNAILFGHRGLPSAKLFTDLDLLKEGDEIILYVLDTQMVYAVKSMEEVLPEALYEIPFESEKDQITLVTCTPYGINTHRLLIYAERAEDGASTGQIRHAISVKAILTGLGVILALAAAVISMYRYLHAKARLKKDHAQNSDSSRENSNA